METDKKIMCAIMLSIIIYMLFIYNQVNTMKMSAMKDNDNLIKRLKNNEEAHDQLYASVEKVNDIILTTKSDETE